MDEKTLIALQGSIAKWEGIVAGTVQDDGALNCPLCQMFSHWVNPTVPKGCKGCPVSERMEMPHCEGTPYYEYTDADESGEASEEEMKECAQHEVDFLKSLLPSDSGDEVEP